LAHTLKGCSGYLSEVRLQQLALQLEQHFKDKENNKFTKRDWDMFEAECTRVLTLAQKAAKTPKINYNFNKARVSDLFTMLMAMLEQDSAESLSFVAELSTLPNTEYLIDALEDCDFRLARTCVQDLRKLLGV
jgi:HPt (histidine-containing phosphotransfer) domain-containing protein